LGLNRSSVLAGRAALLAALPAALPAELPAASLPAPPDPGRFPESDSNLFDMTVVGAAAPFWGGVYNQFFSPARPAVMR
jgi:hypothetical protein